MKKTKLFAGFTVGLTAATPLVAIASCNKGQDEEITDNVVWETKTKSTNEGETTVSFEYSLKKVSEKDKINVEIKEQTGAKISIESQSFDLTSKTGKVTLTMTIDDLYKEYSTDFSVTVSSTEGLVWSQEVTGLKAQYVALAKQVPVDALKVETEGSNIWITGIKTTTNADLSKCKVLYIPSYIDGKEISGVKEDAFSGVCSETGTLKSVEQIKFDAVPRDKFTTIGNNAFYNCSSLTSPITIPSTITTVGESAFKGTNISGLTIGVGTTQPKLTLGKSCFEGTPLKGDLYFPVRVEEIGESAFNDCKQLDGYITLGSYQTAVKAKAFRNCYKIAGIDLSYFGNNIPTDWTPFTASGDDGAFENISKDHSPALWVYDNTASLVTTMTNSLQACSSVHIQFKTDIATSATDFKYDPSGKITGFSDTFELGDKTILYIPEFYNNSGTPTEIKGFADSAFYNKTTGKTKIPSQLTSLVFGSTSKVQSIGASAFRGAQFIEQSSFEGLNLPDTITSIGAYAFADTCFNKSGEAPCELKLPNAITELSSDAFGSTIAGGMEEDNRRFYIDGNTIPSTLTKIGDECFIGCTLRNNTFVVPNTITTVGFNCFGLTKDPNSTDDVLLDFSNWIYAPEWTASKVFGVRFDKGMVKVNDLVTTLPDYYNEWDQYEYSTQFTTFFKKIGLDLTNFTLIPQPRTKYVVAATDNANPNKITGFATYKSNGNTVASTSLNALCKDVTYSVRGESKTYRALPIDSKIGTTNLTEIADKALTIDKDNLYKQSMIVFPSTITKIGKDCVKNQTSILAFDFSSFTYDQIMALELAEHALLINQSGTRELFVDPSFTDTQIKNIQDKVNTCVGGTMYVHVDRAIKA